MTTLQVVPTAGNLAIIDHHGELVALNEAPDRLLLDALDQTIKIDQDATAAKRAIAAELKDRYGVGSTSAAGYAFKLTESQSWPQGATKDALAVLLERKAITRGEADKAMPLKRVPDGRALKALVGRLMAKDPGAAQLLADACTVSAPAVRDLAEDAIQSDVA